MDLKQLEKFTEDFKEFMKIVQDYGPIAIISHDNTDLDGAASALGIYFLLKKYSSPADNIDVILSQTNQFVTQTIQKVNPVEEIILNDLEMRETYKTVVVVDTPYLPPYFRKECKNFILIDHHLEPEYREGENADLSGLIPPENFLCKLIDSSASSCSEIVAQLWRNLEGESLAKSIQNSEIESNLSQLLLMGILMDSGGLRFSQNTVVPILSFLIEKGADLPTARSLSIRKMPEDVKIARIKGASRIQEPIRIGNWIVLITKVNSHESAVCTALLGLGADIAICISKRKNKEFRIIARSSERFQHTNDFHLAKFLEFMAKKFDGNSGGHKGAAGMNGKNYPQDLKKLIIRELKKELNNSILKKSDPE